MEPHHMKRLPPLSTFAKMVFDINQNPKGVANMYYACIDQSENMLSVNR
jgi:hypothetical protein